MIPPDTQLLYPIDKALLAVMILIIMFGMGASLTATDFKGALRRPRLILVGFLSQFGFMPLIAFGISLVLHLPPAAAIALIMVGCLPGGTTSNLFSYFARGQVALSISMTTVSTILALVMTPLLLGLYASPFAEKISEEFGGEAAFVVPTKDIVLSLVLVLVPVAGGLILRRFSRGWAKVAEDTAGFMGMIVILYLIVTAFARHYPLIFSTPLTIYFAAIALGLIGFLFGYYVSQLLGAYPIQQRAISLETGIQNTPIAFTIILLSFPDSAMQNDMLWVAILYSIFIVISSSCITIWYRKIGQFDWDVYRNTIIHTRLFGTEWKTNYPKDFLPSRIAKDPSQGALREDIVREDD
ncbi:MAG: bile acid:sodium symporter [Verrucomicrobiota bacterium]